VTVANARPGGPPTRSRCACRVLHAPAWAADDRSGARAGQRPAARAAAAGHSGCSAMKRATASSTWARRSAGWGWMRIRALTDRSYSARQAASSGSPVVDVVGAVGVEGTELEAAAHADPSTAMPATRTDARGRRPTARSEITRTLRRERPGMEDPGHNVAVIPAVARQAQIRRYHRDTEPRPWESPPRRGRWARKPHPWTCLGAVATGPRRERQRLWFRNPLRCWSERQGAVLTSGEDSGERRQSRIRPGDRVGRSQIGCRAIDW
jgi:hypothetical protein